MIVATYTTEGFRREYPTIYTETEVSAYTEWLRSGRKVHLGDVITVLHGNVTHETFDANGRRMLVI